MTAATVAMKARPASSSTLRSTRSASAPVSAPNSTPGTMLANIIAATRNGE